MTFPRVDNLRILNRATRKLTPCLFNLLQGYPGGVQKILTLSDGSNDLMVNKCCYFIRNVTPGVALDITKCGDADLLFGELGDSALGTIEAILSQTYRPMLNTYDNWGKVDIEKRSDFISEMGLFITNVNEALTSFASGLELRAPDAKLYKAVEVKSNRTALPTEAADHFETLLDEWCNQIERYLELPVQSTSESEDVGPRGELEYWRGRMQKLTSITEQLKRPDCKNVIGILSTLSKNTTDSSKQNVVSNMY